MREPKIILFDLETLPNLAEALKVWPQLSNFPGKTLKATVSTILCAAYKVYGEPKTNLLKSNGFRHTLTKSYKFIQIPKIAITKMRAIKCPNSSAK